MNAVQSNITCWFIGLNVILSVAAAPLPTIAIAETSQSWADANVASLIELYRHFHTHPELSFQEEQTGERLARELKETGAEVTTRVGGFGVVGLLRNGEGPTLMLRTDLDALPVVEQTNLAYASTVKVQDADGAEVGVMHACGHDVHITNLVGVARYLAANKDRWQGTVMFIGQPAEERGAGAAAMLEDGLFERFPKPDFAVAMHVDSGLATGTLAYKGGYALANVDSVDVTMHGRGGHGAYPHTTIDPIVQAAQFVMSVQTLVSREVKPIEPAVITVGSIHGGTKHNIIGNTCHMQLTVRSYDEGVRKLLLEGIARKAKAVAMGAGAAEPTIEISEGTPSLWNDEDLAARLDPVLRRVVGDENVEDAEPSMGGEDFSRYGRAGVPIVMIRLGAVDGERLKRYEQLGQPAPSLHSALFYPDIEAALKTSVPAMSEIAVELLKPQN
ncbi:MAG: amidohydrolase [Planctomycetaceae bacterium]|nr:amidohydrolase [Planctomycetales bacterium]MCB9874644.1 amidohydrolase [Planctomycetaceae bacterium]MCB9936932.1 amidohydrolase [Planctomycetaceae bacterium]